MLSPSVPYFAEYLDLSGATLDGSYSPKSCKDRDQVSDIVMSKKIWACRRLRTLQLRFISKTHDVASTANSRIMFAYIAKVCPRLEVLSIDRVALDLKLESGFCWLTELRFLQRLSILTWTRTELKKQDFEWMAPQPLVRYSFGDVGSNTTWLRRSLTSYSRRLNRPGRSEINSGKPERENLNDLIILKDLENLDLISNLKPYPTDSQLSVEECWPQLEFLGICLTLTNNNEILHSEDHLPDLIAGIRPGVEFSCNYSRW
ncbi:hypothetical protein BGZ49_007417 [Haplosporangium sp. Z 27]|nr:hypothetical protein BGZ49_007417 [Haplosporangium sp. Z 27]